MAAGDERLPVTSIYRRGIIAALFGAAAAACAPIAPLAPVLSATPAPAVAQPTAPAGPPAIEVREHLSGRYIALIGPKAQHAPPFLDTPGTNFYCLRSFVDRTTGAAAHQLYVSDSYTGAERHWDAAHDEAGVGLRFIPISRNEISCEGGCSYAEEFAANLPGDRLRANSAGLTVTFTDRSGDQKTIVVAPAQIAAQLAAVDLRRNSHGSAPEPAAAAAAEPTPQSAPHQPE